MRLESPGRGAKDLQFAEHREIKKMQVLRRLRLLRMTLAVWSN